MHYVTTLFYMFYGNLFFKSAQIVKPIHFVKIERCQTKLNRNVLSRYNFIFINLGHMIDIDTV